MSKRRHVTFYCDPELWEEWRKLAKKAGKSASEMLREAMKARVQRAKRRR